MDSSLFRMCIHLYSGFQLPYMDTLFAGMYYYKRSEEYGPILCSNYYSKIIAHLFRFRARVTAKASTRANIIAVSHFFIRTRIHLQIRERTVTFCYDDVIKLKWLRTVNNVSALPL